jgi:hypothetical protein
MATDTGRGSRRAQTFAAPNQNDGTEALDQAQPSEGEFMSQKKPGTKKYKGAARARLTRQLSDGKELSSRRKYRALGCR